MIYHGFVDETSRVVSIQDAMHGPGDASGQLLDDSDILNGCFVLNQRQDIGHRKVGTPSPRRVWRRTRMLSR